MREFITTLAICGFTAFAQDSKLSFTSFDPPGSVETHGVGINDSGDVVGVFKDALNTYWAFERHSNGTFGAPFQVSNFNTFGAGINVQGTIVGWAYPPGQSEGFFVRSGVLTTFHYPGATLSTLIDINNAGYYVGSYTSGALNNGFLHTKSGYASFGVSGATSTVAYSANTKSEVVGYYINLAGALHAFYRRPNGTVVTFNFPGSTQTVGEGIDDCGNMSGTWYDASNHTHGFYGTPGHFVRLDYPKSTDTALGHKNNKGQIAGRYTDAGGLSHGFVVSGTPACK